MSLRRTCYRCLVWGQHTPCSVYIIHLELGLFIFIDFNISSVHCLITCCLGSTLREVAFHSIGMSTGHLPPLSSIYMQMSCIFYAHVIVPSLINKNKRRGITRRGNKTCWSRFEVHSWLDVDLNLWIEIQINLFYNTCPDLWVTVFSLDQSRVRMSRPFCYNISHGLFTPSSSK